MRYVVVGGGIAGVSCAYKLLEGIEKNDTVMLISASDHVKVVSNWIKIGQFAEYFTVRDSKLFPEDKRFSFLNAEVRKWDCDKKTIETESNEIQYDRLCIATGALPRLQWKHPKIIALRDSHSVGQLKCLLNDAQTVAIVGNGGIATELVYELQNTAVHWIIRDVYPSSVFFLPQVSKFLEHRILQKEILPKSNQLYKRDRFTISDGQLHPEVAGCALGPDWNSAVSLKGSSDSEKVTLHCREEVIGVSSDQSSSLMLTMSSQTNISCDFAIWATGVIPSSAFWKDNCNDLKLSEDAGITIDEQMRTSVHDVYACGDVCTICWPSIENTWKQMRLWTQARQMGIYCAKSMLSSVPTELDFCFEIFAHVTSFCGMKVVFLGDFKGENQSSDWYIRERIIGDTEYVCCVMVDHRVVGSTLIGDTNLEETIENLILNKTDLSQIEEHFLDPGIDIEDYFD